MKKLFETYDPDLLEKVAIELTTRGFGCEPVIRDIDGLVNCALIVSEEDYDSMSDLIEGIVEDLVYESSAVECPMCHSTNIVESHVEEDDILVPAVAGEVNCLACGHKWRNA